MTAAGAGLAQLRRAAGRAAIRCAPALCLLATATGLAPAVARADPGWARGRPTAVEERPSPSSSSAFTGAWRSTTWCSSAAGWCPTPATIHSTRPCSRAARGTGSRASRPTTPSR